MKKSTLYVIIFIIFAQQIVFADTNKNLIITDYPLVVLQYEQGESVSYFMQKIYLYAGRQKANKQTDIYVTVDDRDYAYLNQWKWGLMKLYHCDNPITYARRYEWVNGKYTAILMHRVILGLKDRREHGDHISGNTMDNQRSNLRQATHTENMNNRRKSTLDPSKYKGIFLNKNNNKWTTCFILNKKTINKRADTEIGAVREFNKLVTLHRDFSKIYILP